MIIDNKKRGFIIIAFGDYYCKLAKDLVISYKVLSCTKYPFYVMTNRQYENQVKPYFDGTIIVDDLYGTFLDKIFIYNNTPFDETIFIDSDSNIISDISNLFDVFAKHNYDISVIGNKIKFTNDYQGRELTKKEYSILDLKKIFSSMEDFIILNEQRQVIN